MPSPLRSGSANSRHVRPHRRSAPMQRPMNAALPQVTVMTTRTTRTTTPASPATIPPAGAQCLLPPQVPPQNPPPSPLEPRPPDTAHPAARGLSTSRSTRLWTCRHSQRPSQRPSSRCLTTPIATSPSPPPLLCRTLWPFLAPPLPAGSSRMSANRTPVRTSTTRTRVTHRAILPAAPQADLLAAPRAAAGLQVTHQAVFDPQHRGAAVTTRSPSWCAPGFRTPTTQARSTNTNS